MSSSDSQNHHHQYQNDPLGHDLSYQKRKKDYACPCGKLYGSYPAIYAHIKKKHDGKAPGQILKPKPARRRGRPFKYQPTKLQSQNPHRSASKHLYHYLMEKPQNQHLNQYPLKQFAERNSKSPFPAFKYGEDEFLKQKYTYENVYPKDQRSPNKIDLPGYAFGLKNERQPLPNDQSFPHDWDPHQTHSIQTIQNQQRLRINPVEEKDPSHRFGTNQNLVIGEAYLRDYKRLSNQKPNLQNIPFNPNDPLYTRFQLLQQQSSRDPYGRGYDASIQSMYLKPFEIQLRQEMEAKFKPISQGITHFLEPILQQLLNQTSLSQPEKPIQIDENTEQKPGQQQKLAPQLNNGSLGQENDQKSQNQLSSQELELRRNQTLKNQHISISSLLQNQHFRDILKWLMSPPEQNPSQRIKENYIEFSFRCCLVEFLDFLHNFLETVQHEQVLLALVFFCDHILAETGSFQLQPEPQIYEMGLYLNSFINEYLPKLSKFMECLENFYMFKDMKKKVSELFMWMSSWQAIQQYYHNRYHRQKMIFEISQQNYKCMMYQRKYQSYITEAMRGCNGGVDQLRNARFQPDRELDQIHQNEVAQQKDEDNPEINVINTQNVLGGNDNEVRSSLNSQENSQSLAKPNLSSPNSVSGQSGHDQNQISKSVDSEDQNQAKKQGVDQRDQNMENQGQRSQSIKQV